MKALHAVKTQADGGIIKVHGAIYCYQNFHGGGGHMTY